MSLLNKIKAASLQARKDRHALSSKLLSTLLGDAVMIGKNDGNRESTDGEVIAVIKKFIANANGTIEYINNIPVRKNEVDRQQIEDLRAEITILTGFLPKQMTTEELTMTVDILIAGLGAKTRKDMGKVMKALKDAYEGTYDGSAASELIKSKLV